MAAALYYSQSPGAVYHAENQLGARSFNHGPSSDVESRYDELRDQARRAHDGHPPDYDGMRKCNKQAADYIFHQNNSAGRVKENEIDLHGLFVAEAKEHVQDRLAEMRSNGDPGPLHVIVGKGNHSPGHIQKIKPAIEDLCRQMHLREETEHNEGRIKVFLGPGGAGFQSPPQSPGQHLSPAPYSHSPPHSPPHASPHSSHHGSPHQQSPYQPPSYGQPSPWAQPSPFQPSPGYAGEYPGQQQPSPQPGKPEYSQQHGNSQSDFHLTKKQEKQLLWLLKRCLRQCC